MNPMQIWRDGRPIFYNALALQALILVVAFFITGLSIDVPSIALILLPVLACAGIALAYRHREDAPKLAVGAEATTILMATLSISELITYAAGSASAPFPYVDANLRAVGVAMGFDWVAYARMINEHPWLCRVLDASYNSFNLQPILLLLVLTVCNEVARLRIFLLATLLALTLTCAVFIFMPAISAYGYFGDQARQFTNIYPPVGDTHVAILNQHISFLEGLRSGSLKLVSAETLTGLITFPSFHACAAFLFLWGLWTIRLLRYPALLLNLLMLAASPLFGAHYLVDLVAGIAVAIASIAGASALFARRSSVRLPPGLGVAPLGEPSGPCANAARLG